MIERERTMYEARIENFITRLKGSYYRDELPLEIKFCKFDPHVDFNARLTGEYKPILVGDSWGQNWERAWFHIFGSVPETWKGETVIARINLGGESILFANDGTPLLGLSHHTLWGPAYEFARDRIMIVDSANGGERFEFWLESSAGQLFGLKLNVDQGDIAPLTSGSHIARVNYALLTIFKKELWHLYLDVRVLNDLMKSMPVQSVRRARILRTLNRAINCYTGDEESVREARSILSAAYASKATPSDLSTSAVGHAHIDTAWLWPLDETIRKCARTFSSQIDLIDRYPEYIFGASQPQQYEFIKMYYPQLYEKIKERVKQGRWELLGVMWVEPDCNLAGGESLIRQLLHGKNYFKDEFGIEIDHLWLPDVFGYSAALPQILKKADVHYLVTQKISWNQFNKFPFHTFRWRGIDGTEVIVHFPPEDNYNSELLPAKLVYARDNFNEKDFLDQFLTLFGIGDGGCGPTEEIIEFGLRQSDLEGAPRVKFAHARDFLRDLMSHESELPLWVGELYLELHRGTLTTQAFIKKANRRMELNLREIEFLFSLIPLEHYPSAELDQMWKRVLLNQFHDILPGSSITRVYEDCKKDYERLNMQAEELKRKAISVLCQEDHDSLTLINTLSFEFQAPVALPQSWANYEIEDELGHSVPVQCEDGIPLAAVTIPPMSSAVLKRKNYLKSDRQRFEDKHYVLENDLIRYEFDETGQLSRIFDKEYSKEVLEAGKNGNIFSLYDDRPVAWDAWDIDIFYEKQKIGDARLVSREWVCDGPVRQGFRQYLKIGHSAITQEIYLSRRSKRLDFRTHVHWLETHKMLRVSFVVDIYCDQASYEIQYGYLKRATHRNTSWDMAKFEAPAQRYVDLSDMDYGVALLNDCKYGHKVYGNVLDLNILRSPTSPDPQADRGTHELTFSLLPHTGALVDSDVFSEAAQLNQPPLLFEGFVNREVHAPLKLDSQDITVEVIKKAEREDALIVRLYEHRGKHASVNVVISPDYRRVAETNLMENELALLSVDDGHLKLDFKPFEIKTLKLS
ncbi:alpha-mannosidase [candidate division KSB1 bacterium]|nr:alpha-mannosidase [candidate division KSB1 bacterium]